MISTFNNRPISDMSRDDLIVALDQAMGMLNAARRARDFDRDMRPTMLSMINAYNGLSDEARKGLAFDREMQQFAVGLVSSHTNAYRARPVMRQIPQQRQEVF
jgi:hypothetical protein